MTCQLGCEWSFFGIPVRWKSSRDMWCCPSRKKRGAPDPALPTRPPPRGTEEQHLADAPFGARSMCCFSWIQGPFRPRLAVSRRTANDSRESSGCLRGPGWTAACGSHLLVAKAHSRPGVVPGRTVAVYPLTGPGATAQLPMHFRGSAPKYLAEWRFPQSRPSVVASVGRERGRERVACRKHRSASRPVGAADAFQHLDSAYHTQGLGGEAG
jgi:hypothetical protein